MRWQVAFRRGGSGRAKSCNVLLFTCSRDTNIQIGEIYGPSGGRVDSRNRPIAWSQKLQIQFIRRVPVLFPTNLRLQYARAAGWSMLLTSGWETSLYFTSPLQVSHPQYYSHLAINSLPTRRVVNDFLSMLAVAPPDDWKFHPSRHPACPLSRPVLDLISGSRLHASSRRS